MWSDILWKQIGFFLNEFPIPSKQMYCPIVWNQNRKLHSGCVLDPPVSITLQWNKDNSNINNSNSLAYSKAIQSPIISYSNKSTTCNSRPSTTRAFFSSPSVLELSQFYCILSTSFQDLLLARGELIQFAMHTK